VEGRRNNCCVKNNGVDNQSVYESLSAKHRCFVDAYLDMMNATRAYMRVYPNVKYESARALAVALLRKPTVDSAIREKMNEAMPVEEVRFRLARHARASIEDVVKLHDEPKEEIKYVNGELVEVDMQASVDLASVIENGKGDLVKSAKYVKGAWHIVLVDSQSALRTLAQMHGLLEPVRDNEDDLSALDKLFKMIEDDGNSANT